jgi:pimeloyl-ACP methyl ester carboxylesterase
MNAAPDVLRELLERFDPSAFDARKRRVRLRLVVEGEGEWDALIENGGARLVAAGARADAALSADRATWRRIAADVRGGMRAYRSGRLSIRHNMHLGVAFLAATSGMRGEGRLRFRSVQTARVRLSIVEAGTGVPVLAIHGLGGTKGSFLPTVAALAQDGRFRVIALDLPGFGDSDKPIRAPYDARYFAGAVIDLLDALELERAHVVGNSLGGRVALELGMSHPDRVRRLGLLAPALAWLRDRPLAPLLRLARPELGLVQFAPRPLVEAIIHRLIPGADAGWTAAGVDEFLRVYLTPAGRAALYAAGRQIYLDEPHGEQGFWTRLRELEPPSLFVWGRRDRLVPISFARHVTDAVPHARHLELDCGHVPQIERPRKTHEALARFFAEAGGTPGSRAHARGVSTKAQLNTGPRARAGG